MAITPAELVQTNLKRLRTLKGWTQAEVAAAVRRQGIAPWSSATVGLIEAGRRRADHLIDMAVLCAVFQVPLEELLRLEPDEHVAGGGAPLTSGALIAALAGTPPSFDGDDIQNPDDLNELARLLGVDRGELTFISFDVFGQPDLLKARDASTLMVADLATDAATWKRDATHRVLGQVREVLDRDGLVAVLARGERAVMKSFLQGDLSFTKPKEDM